MHDRHRRTASRRARKHAAETTATRADRELVPGPRSAGDRTRAKISTVATRRHRDRHEPLARTASTNALGADSLALALLELRKLIDEQQAVLRAWRGRTRANSAECTIRARACRRRCESPGTPPAAATSGVARSAAPRAASCRDMPGGAGSIPITAAIASEISSVDRLRVRSPAPRRGTRAGRSWPAGDVVDVVRRRRRGRAR